MSKGRSLRRRMWDGLGTGLLAVVLAVVVWVNAIYQADRPREDLYPESIPVEILNVPNGLTVTNRPAERANVRINAFASSWSGLTGDAFRATVEVAGLAEGVHAVPLKVTCSDRTVTIVRTQPETVYVRLEPLRRAAVEVKVNLENKADLPLGYAVDPPEVEPRFVNVEGPASIVESVKALSASVSLAGLRTSAEREVEPRAVDADGNPVSGVKLTPSKVTVRFDIQRKLNYREVAVLVRTEGKPARGYFVSSVDIEPATVTLVGPPAVIADMPGVISARGTVDVAGATRLIAQRLQLDLPEGVSVLSERQGESKSLAVLVTVEIDAVKGGTTVELPLRSRRVGEGLTARLSVATVDVILTGPAVLLDDLEIALVEAYVDLGGLGVGTHQAKTAVEVRVSKNPKLADLLVTSISPTFVEAEIREAPTATPTALPTLTPGLTITGTLTARGTPTATLMAVPSRTATLAR